MGWGEDGGRMEDCVSELEEVAIAVEFDAAAAAKHLANLLNILTTEENAVKEFNVKYRSCSSTLLSLLEKGDGEVCVNVLRCMQVLLGPKSGSTRLGLTSDLRTQNGAHIVLALMRKNHQDSAVFFPACLAILSKIALKDKKFALKVRLSGALRVLVGLLKTYQHKTSSLIHLLQVIKLSSKSGPNRRFLHKEGVLPLLMTILSQVPRSQGNLLKTVIETMANLTKSKSISLTGVKLNLVSALLPVIQPWEGVNLEKKIKAVKASVIVLSHLTDTKIGRKAVIADIGLQALHDLIVVCPDEEKFDPLVRRVNNIIHRCAKKLEIPVATNDSPWTFTLPELQDKQDSSESTDGSKGSRESSPGTEEEEDASSSSEEEDIEEPRTDTPFQNNEHYNIPYLPETRNIEELKQYEKFFQEIRCDEETPCDSQAPELPTLAHLDWTFNRSFKDPRLISAIDMEASDEDRNCSYPSFGPEYRKLFKKLSSKTRTVIPVVKLAHPDLHGCGAAEVREEFHEKSRSVCRKKILMTVDQLQQGGKPLGPVIYSADRLEPAYLPNTVEDNFYELEALNLQDDCGHLRFEARFESGNLRTVYKVNEFEYDLILNPDVNSSVHVMWFYFQVSGMKADRRYTFNIINCEKQNSMHNFGMKPIMYSVKQFGENGLGWMRSGTDICYYKNCYERNGKSCYSTSFTLTFPHSQDVCYVASHYPYTYTALMTHITLWEQQLKNSSSNIYFRRDTLCHSLNGNPLPLLTITSKADSCQDRDVIFLSARVHPGESNSSWVLHGALKYLLKESAEAELLRRAFIFKVIPMLNPEGVINGCHRCGLTNEDLNRKWREPDSKLHPTIYHSKGLAMFCSRILKRTPWLFCDFHGHSRRYHAFFYGCSRQHSWWQPDRLYPNLLEVQALPLAMSLVCGSFSLEQCSYNVEKSRESTARVVFWREFGVQQSYTMETTYAGCNQGALNGCHVNVQALLSIGQQFSKAILRVIAEEHTYWVKLLNEKSNLPMITFDVLSSSSFDSSDEEEVR